MSAYYISEVQEMLTRPGISPPDGFYSGLIDVAFVDSKDKRGRRRKRKLLIVEARLAKIETRDGRLYDAGRTLLLRAIPLMQPASGCYCGLPMEPNLILLAAALQDYCRRTLLPTLQNRRI